VAAHARFLYDKTTVHTMKGALVTVISDSNPSVVTVKPSNWKDILTMTALRAFETLATLYQSTQYNIPEGVNL
jgi:hypothetical protein